MMPCPRRAKSRPRDSRARVGATTWWCARPSRRSGAEQSFSAHWQTGCCACRGSKQACTRGQARNVSLRAGSGMRAATASMVSTACWALAKAASRLFCPACDRASRWVIDRSSERSEWGHAYGHAPFVLPPLSPTVSPAVAAARGPGLPSPLPRPAWPGRRAPPTEQSRTAAQPRQRC